MTQLIPATGVDLQDKFRTLVYQAIVGPAPLGSDEGATNAAGRASR